MINDMGIQLDDQHLVLINLGPMYIRWPVSTRLKMVVLEAQGGVVLSVAWPLPSGSASVH